MRADLLDGQRRATASRRLGLVVAAGLAAAALASLQGWIFSAHSESASPSAVAATAVPVTKAPGTTPVVPGLKLPEAASPSTATSLKTRPLSAWLADVARDARCDLVISPELRGDLTASEASPLPWEQRIEAYSRVFGFTFVVRDGLIEVTRGVPLAQADREGATEGATADLSSSTDAADSSPRRGRAGSASAVPATVVTSEEPSPETRVVKLAYSAAKDTAAVLEKAGKALEVTVAADVSGNAIVLSGQPAALARVSSVLKELDRPRRRILLDAKIVEVTHSARLDLGVEWKIAGSKVGGDVKFPATVSDAGSAALLIATGGATALDARISALEAGGKLHVVSRPSVVMLEGSPATIESARILRIRLPARGAVVADDVVESPASGRATEEIPVGVRLEVTPAVRGGGRVLLRIKAKSSSLGAPLPPDDIPEELSRMVDAEVLVTSGETAVLGGLTRESGTNSGSGIPGLRRLPIAGALFGKKSDEKEEEELMVIVTPRVLD